MTPPIVAAKLAACTGAWVDFAYFGVLSLASVQLEEGENANKFAYEDHYKTLEKCQRFYETGESNIAVVTDAANNSPGAFKLVQMKRTKRNRPDIFVKVESTTGPFDTPFDIGAASIDERKFVIEVGVTGSTPGIRKLKATWIADSEIPLYNNIQIADDGTVGRTTTICDEETACHLAANCKLNLPAEENPGCDIVSGYLPRAMMTAPRSNFTMYFSEIPSAEMDAEYETALGDMWGGLCFYYYENSVEQWPYSLGEPGGSDPRNNYWIMITGPRYDSLGRPCDPVGPTASDGTGGVWSPIGQYWSAWDEWSRHNTNRSFRGRSGWGLPSGEWHNTDIQDARTFADYAITNLDFEAKTGEVLYPSYFSNTYSNYWDWTQRGCAGPVQVNGACAGSVRIDPMLEESKDYIYHQLSGTSGENIVVTYRTMVDNLVALARYVQSAPTTDIPLAGKPTGYYGWPYVDLWGQPIVRDAANNPVGVGYNTLTPEQRSALKDYAYKRFEPILLASDYLQPSFYNLYTQAFLGDGTAGSINNNNPAGAYYSPFFKQSPWGGAAQTQQNWEDNNRDKIEIAKRAGKPIYPAISTMMWSAGQTIEMGAEYHGWHFTTMCNPSCTGSGVAATSPSGVVGNCYEGWRCWDKVMPIQDFIDTQIKPIIEMGGDGAVYWWSPSYWQVQSAARTQEMGDWWTVYTDTNPNLTQYSIADFPAEITGPDGSRWKRDDVADISRVARWYWVIDTYPYEMRQEIARLGLESNPTIAAWIASYPALPAGQTFSVAFDGRIFFSSRQQYFNVRYANRQFFIEYLLDGADPSNPSDPRLGAKAGVTPGLGWYNPALHRFLKIAWSKYQLHFATAAKQYVQTNTYAADWDVVTAFGGQVDFDNALALVESGGFSGLGSL